MHKGIHVGLLIVMAIVITSCSFSSETAEKQSTDTPPATIFSSTETQDTNYQSVCDNRKDASLYEELLPLDPSGKIAYTAVGVYLINPVDNYNEKVYPVDAFKYYGRYGPLAWSPDGTMLAVVHYWYQRSGSVPSYSLEVVDFPNRQVCSVVDGRGELSLPAWSPDSRNLTVADWDSNELLNIAIPGSEASVIDNIVTRGTKPQWIDIHHVAFLQNNENTLRHLYTTP